MTLLAWTALMGGGIAVGIGVVLMLALPSRWDAAAAIVPIGATLVAIAGLQAIIQLTGRFDTAAFALFLSAAASLGGYALAAGLLASLRPRAASLAPVPTVRTLVLFVACAEEERYSPTGVVTAVRAMRAAGTPTAPDAAMPFVCAAEKARYRALGASPARRQLRRLAERMEALMASQEVAVRPLWCGEGDTLARSLASLPDSVRTLVVAPVTVAGSPLMDGLVAEIDGPGVPDSGRAVIHVPPLSTSKRMATLIADRSARALQARDDGSGGVVLVSEGRPFEWDETDPVYTERETYFAHRVRALLEESGLDADRVRTAWSDWRTPDVTDSIRHIVAFGARHVVAVPVSAPADTFGTLIDLPEAVAQARVEDGVQVDVLGGWGDDPEVALALTEHVRSAIEEAGGA